MDKPQTSIMSLLGPKGNGVRILSIDGGDGRCFSQLLMLEELTHRIEYDHGRSVRPCEFFHFITGVGAGGVIAILLGVLGMDTENAITAFAAICEKVFDLNVRDEASRSERLTLAMKAILDDLHIPHNTRMEGDIDRGAGCRVSICYSSALINGCRMFRNYKARRPSYNPTIIEAARVSWATPGLFSSIRLGLRSRQEELVSAVNGFNNPMLEAVQEAREVFGKERAVSTFLSLGSGMRGPVSIHSSDSLRSSVQQTDITEEDIERRLGPTGLYFRFSPEHTIQGETSDIESDLSSITSYTCAYLEREKTIRSMESFLDVSAHTSSYNLELRLEARLLNMATHLQRVSNTVQPSTSHEDQDLLAELKNSGLPGIPPRAGCMKGTREHILRSVNDWTTDFGAPNILWLKGHPGVGKSAIATNVVEQLRASGRFGSCFFFQRQKATTMTPRAMWCTVAYDLARRYPTVQTSVVATLKAGEISPGTSSIEKLFQHLIHEPLSESADIPSEKMPVIVIDALDECGGLDGRHSEYRRNLVKTLENWGHLPGRFKLIVTSREEKDIERLFSATPHRQIEIQAGQTVDEQSSIDIRTFLTGRFQQIALDYASLPAQWPGAERVKELGDKAAGLFIWAETVVKFIENGAPSQRLDQVLKGKGTGDIGALYEQILNTSFHDPTEEDIGRFRSIVGTIILAKVGLYIPSLAQLLSTEDSMVEHICIGLYSVLDSQDILRFHHQSFVDFLIDRDRCPPKFYVDLRQANMELSLRCLTIMTKELKFNICGLENSHRSNAEIPDLKYRVQQRIPEALQYSCMHWSSHLCFNMEPASMAVISGQLDIFLKGEWLLYWLEVLSVMGKVAVAISVLREIKACSEKFEEQHLYLIDDVLRFVLAFYTPISTSTPHIYLSALPFLPKESMLWENVGKSFPNLLDACKGRMQSWPARPFEWRGHTSNVSSIAFSPDGRRLASGSSDDTVRIWDTETGAAMGEPLRGHTGYVICIAYSPDGRHVASGSRDQTIRIWDSEKGTAVGEPLMGHNDYVRSIAYSPDGLHIISGSRDYTIRIWDAKTGASVGKPLKGHTNGVSSVAYAPGGRHIVSGSDDKSIRIWDMQTGAVVGQPLRGHVQEVLSVAYSPDGQHIVSGSADKTIRIWNSETGEKMGGSMEAYDLLEVLSVAYSPDGYQIISGSSDNDIRIWDVATRVLIGVPLKGHTGSVRSVAYSPDGQHIISGSVDSTIRIWDAEEGGPAGEPLKGHTGWVWSVTYSQDGRHILSGSCDHTIRIWDSETGAAVVEPLKGHTDYVRSVAYSPDGRYIISGSDDGTIRFWDSESGVAVSEPLTGHTGSVWSIAYSPGGQRIISGSSDRTIRIWDKTTGATIGEPLKGHTDYVRSVAYSPDGRHIISGSDDGTVRTWDADVGTALGEPLEGHTGWVWCVAYSPDGQHIISGSSDHTIRIWDMTTGATVGMPLMGHTGNVRSVAYSPDGRYIVSGSDDRTIRIWNSETGVGVGDPLRGHLHDVLSVAYSPDGQRILSGSFDCTVRVWNAVSGAEHKGNIAPVSDELSAQTREPAEHRSTRRLDVSAFSGHTIPAEILDSNGWLHDEDGLLFWVPEDCRHGLICPAILAIPNTGRDRCIRLDFTHFRYGNSWTNVRGGRGGGPQQWTMN